jgi:hypothetical protein
MCTLTDLDAPCCAQITPIHGGKQLLMFAGYKGGVMTDF